jgi:hypothetical protein
MRGNTSYNNQNECWVPKRQIYIYIYIYIKNWDGTNKTMRQTCEDKDKCRMLIKWKKIWSRRHHTVLTRQTERQKRSWGEMANCVRIVSKEECPEMKNQPYCVTGKFNFQIWVHCRLPASESEITSAIMRQAWYVEQEGTIHISLALFFPPSNILPVLSRRDLSHIETQSTSADVLILINLPVSNSCVYFYWLNNSLFYIPAQNKNRSYTSHCDVSTSGVIHDTYWTWWVE